MIIKSPANVFALRVIHKHTPSYSSKKLSINDNFVPFHEVSFIKEYYSALANGKKGYLLL